MSLVKAGLEFSTEMDVMNRKLGTTHSLFEFEVDFNDDTITSTLEIINNHRGGIEFKSFINFGADRYYNLMKLVDADDILAYAEDNEVDEVFLWVANALLSQEKPATDKKAGK